MEELGIEGSWFFARKPGNMHNDTESSNNQTLE